MWPDFYELMTGPGRACVRRSQPAPARTCSSRRSAPIPVATRSTSRRCSADAHEDGEIARCDRGQSPAEAREFWRLRDSSGEFPRLGWPALGYDIGIPTRDIGRFVDACGEALEYAVAGNR